MIKFFPKKFNMSNNINPEFSNKIKSWSVYEQKYQELKNEMSKISDQKEQLTKEIVNYIQVHNMQRIAINVGNKKIYYHEEQTNNNLSFGFLKDCLMTYFNNDEKKVEQLINFVKSKRTKSVKPNLKFIIKK